MDHHRNFHVKHLYPIFSYVIVISSGKDAALCGEPSLLSFSFTHSEEIFEISLRFGNKIIITL